MARGREFPHGFAEAVKVAKQILSSDHELVRSGRVDSEAEQLVVAAFRKAGGKNLSRLELYSRLSDRYPEQAGRELIDMATLRAEGETLQHLTGYQFFLEHEYDVGPEVLIPRPETEVLVTSAIEVLSAQSPFLGFEVGAGSGAISIELLSRFSGLRMVATELSAPAIEIARKNSLRILGNDATRRLELLQVTGPEVVLEAFRERADFIISNPPYLTRTDGIDSDVLRNEPEAALFAPVGDPLYFYRRICDGAAERITKTGKIFLEIPHERSQQILNLFQNTGWNARLRADLTGRDRVLMATR